jgi:uncharacterized membrane protein YwzB
MGFKPLSNALCLTYYGLQITETDKFVKKMEELQQFLTDEMIWA